METQFFRAVRLVAIIGVAALAFPAHAAKVDFTEFAGKYKSTYLLQAEGTTAFGNISVNVKVPKNGSSATVVLSGAVSASGTTVPITATLRMKANGRMTANSILMGLLGTSATKPTRFKGRKNSFRFTLKPKPGAILNDFPLVGQMKYTMRFSGNSLVINGSGAINETPLPLQIKIQGDKRK